MYLTEIYWEEIAEKILFAFGFDVWPGARTLALRILSQLIDLIDYGETRGQKCKILKDNFNLTCRGRIWDHNSIGPDAILAFDSSSKIFAKTIFLIKVLRKFLISRFLWIILKKSVVRNRLTPLIDTINPHNINDMSS